MSEKRKPISSFLLRKGSKKAIKIELFSGKLFPSSTFKDCSGGRVSPKVLHKYYRIRVSGRWFSRKVLYTKKETLKLLSNLLLEN